MIDSGHKSLSIYRQCKLLSVNRSNYYYQPKPEKDYNLQLMKIIDEEYLKYPFYGSRQMMRHLNRMGYVGSRNRIRRLMGKMGISAIYQKPKTSKSAKDHKIYPYLLRNLKISGANQVWCSDITYIRMRKGFMYLVAVKDWYSRKILSWKISNSLDNSFCLEALQDAITKYGKPEIFNTDQGSQYTSNDFTNLLLSYNIRISMDGKGRWVDNVFIERVWRSLKYECIYLNEYNHALELKKSIGEWINFYNDVRPHSTFDGNTPNEVFNDSLTKNNPILAA